MQICEATVKRIRELLKRDRLTFYMHCRIRRVCRFRR